MPCSITRTGVHAVRRTSVCQNVCWPACVIEYASFGFVGCRGQEGAGARVRMVEISKVAAGAAAVSVSLVLAVDQP